LRGALELITAVAQRDADPRDIVEELRKRGFDSLDLLVDVIARAARQPAEPKTVKQKRSPSSRLNWKSAGLYTWNHML
jgi:hypothetical protein